LLPGGFDAKLTVDRAIALVSPVGNLLEDIHRCKVGMQPVYNDVPATYVSISADLLKHKKAQPTCYAPSLVEIDITNGMQACQFLTA
jgi:hypothetical protein